MCKLDDSRKKYLRQRPAEIHDMIQLCSVTSPEIKQVVYEIVEDDCGYFWVFARPLNDVVKTLIRELDQEVHP